MPPAPPPTGPPAQGIEVRNYTLFPIQRAVLYKHGLAWNKILPGFHDAQHRDPTEVISIKDPLDETRRVDFTLPPELYVKPTATVVCFYGFDKDITIRAEPRVRVPITVNNTSDETVLATVTNTLVQHLGDLRLLKPSDSARWELGGWRTAVVRNIEDTKRHALHFNTDGGVIVINFVGWEEDEPFTIDMRPAEQPEHIIYKIPPPPPPTFMLPAIGDLNIAETPAAAPLPVLNYRPAFTAPSAQLWEDALKIVKEQNDASTSVASLPGGLDISPYKLEMVELFSTGKRLDLMDRKNIKNLARIMDHMNYGLAQPAVVVSVSPEYVKLACYTDEFDGIVVVAYPTEAVVLVTPEGRKPEIGMKMLNVCLFMPRCACPNVNCANRHLAADIVQGPRGRGVWTNFHPVCAQFTCDDKQIAVWNTRIDQLTAEDPTIWDRIWEYWLNWKDTHGPNYFRVASYMRGWEISTERVRTAAPPNYLP